MRKSLIIIGVLSFLILGMLPILFLGGHRTKWPNVSVTLLGYTNDSKGSRLATFVVTNLGQSAVIREAGYWIQSPGSIPQNGNNLSWNLFTAGRKSRLLPGEAETLLVAAPTNQSSWRISLNVSYPEARAQKVVRETLDGANILKHWFAFRSDWINQ